MKLTICCCLFALVLSVTDGFRDDLRDAFSDKELLEVADMYQHSLVSSGRYRRGLEDLSDNHVRHIRRMTPNYKLCCGDRRSRNVTVKIQKLEVVKQCVKKAKSSVKVPEEFVNPILHEFSCERLTYDKHKHYCINECLLKENGALKEDGTYDILKIKEFFTKEISADWLTEITEKAIEKCSEKKETIEKFDENYECGPQTTLLHNCVWKEVILTCPENHMKKTEYCSKVKKAFAEME